MPNSIDRSFAHVIQAWRSIMLLPFSHGMRVRRRCSGRSSHIHRQSLFDSLFRHRSVTDALGSGMLGGLDMAASWFRVLATSRRVAELW